MPRKRGLYGTSPPSVRHRYAMGERKHFVPHFDNIKGAINGYDPEDVSVSEHNVKALVETLFDYETLQINDATRSWVAFWRYLNDSQAFWWKYFVGWDTEVETKLQGKVPGEAISEWVYADKVEYEEEREAFRKQQKKGRSETSPDS